jgi:hypothetical protein
MTSKKYSASFSKVFDKTFEGLNDTFKDLSGLFQTEEIKNAFAEMQDCRIENDKMIVDVNGSAVEIKGEVTSIKINGKVVFPV